MNPEETIYHHAGPAEIIYHHAGPFLASKQRQYGKEKRRGKNNKKKRPSFCPVSLTAMLCNTLQVALTKTLPNSLAQVEIEATELRSGIAYEARVRWKVSENENSYHSQWSEWSHPTVFKRAGKKNVVFILFHSCSFPCSKKEKLRGKMKLFKSELAFFKYS